MKGPVDAAAAIENYVRRAYILVDEPDELLIDPSLQFDLFERDGVIHGDCDDSSMLVAVLLHAIGLRARFKAIESLPDGSFQHVFTEYWHDGLARWIPVDATMDGIPVYAFGDYITEEL
jgi:transglutaminase-like putative cysteine protease